MVNGISLWWTVPVTASLIVACFSFAYLVVRRPSIALPLAIGSSVFAASLLVFRLTIMDEVLFAVILISGVGYFFLARRKWNFGQLDRVQVLQLAIFAVLMVYFGVEAARGALVLESLRKTRWVAFHLMLLGFSLALAGNILAKPDPRAVLRAVIAAGIAYYLAYLFWGFAAETVRGADRSAFQTYEWASTAYAAMPAAVVVPAALLSLLKEQNKWWKAASWSVMGLVELTAVYYDSRSAAFFLVGMLAVALLTVGWRRWLLLATMAGVIWGGYIFVLSPDSGRSISIWQDVFQNTGRAFYVRKTAFYEVLVTPTATAVPIVAVQPTPTPAPARASRSPTVAAPTSNPVVPQATPTASPATAGSSVTPELVPAPVVSPSPTPVPAPSASSPTVGAPTSTPAPIPSPTPEAVKQRVYVTYDKDVDRVVRIEAAVSAVRDGSLAEMLFGHGLRTGGRILGPYARQGLIERGRDLDVRYVPGEIPEDIPADAFSNLLVEVGLAGMALLALAYAASGLVILRIGQWQAKLILLAALLGVVLWFAAINSYDSLIWWMAIMPFGTLYYLAHAGASDGSPSGAPASAVGTRP